jgi:hypothetical protein
MFKNKKWIFLLIVLFPSLFWVILETSTINSRKLLYYGPKEPHGTDTTYYTVKSTFQSTTENSAMDIDTAKYPVYVLMFIKDKYADDAFRISAFWEYVNYKTDKIEKIPFVFVCEKENGHSETEKNVRAMAKKTHNILFAGWDKNSFDSINKTYFKEKPWYVDYSCFVLIDKKRHIRGYYDGRTVVEVKRMLDEYKHLRIKEDKESLINENSIKQHS